MNRRQSMRPWKAGVLAAVVWFLVMMAAAYVHTEILIDNISPETDFALSALYCQAAGIGALALGILFYVRQKRR